MRQTRLDGVRLVLGDEACHWCDREGFEGQAVKFRDKECPKCKGTGRRGNGRCRNCKDYAESWRRDALPAGRVPDYEAPYAVGPCAQCDGKRYKAMRSDSYLSTEIMREIVDTIGVRVITRTGDMSWGEQHLGMIADGNGGAHSALWSSVDYGRTWDRMITAGAPIGDDDTTEARKARVEAEIDVWRGEMIEKIAAERTQACKVSFEHDVLGSTILLLLSRQGYTVITARRPAEEVAQILADIDTAAVLGAATS